jgi:hypothetical protein
MLLAEHCVLSLTAATSLSGEDVHDFSDLLAELGEPLHHVILICELVQNLLNHISQFIKNSVLQIDQILFVCLMWHFMVQIFKILVSVVSM